MERCLDRKELLTSPMQICDICQSLERCRLAFGARWPGYLYRSSLALEAGLEVGPNRDMGVYATQIARRMKRPDTRNADLVPEHLGKATLQLEQVDRAAGELGCTIFDRREVIPGSLPWVGG